jgi:hypothetical protein
MSGKIGLRGFLILFHVGNTSCTAGSKPYQRPTDNHEIETVIIGAVLSCTIIGMVVYYLTRGSNSAGYQPVP